MFNIVFFSLTLYIQANTKYLVSSKLQIHLRAMVEKFILQLLEVANSTCESLSGHMKFQEATQYLHVQKWKINHDSSL